MKIIRCPKCDRNGGSLHFQTGRIGTRPYPYVKHYDSSKKSGITWCYISASKISQIEFVDSRCNAWKSILDPKDWHKISDLVSQHSDIDLHRNITDEDKIQERFLEIINSGHINTRKFQSKLPEIEKFWRHDKEKFDMIMSILKNLEKLADSLLSRKIMEYEIIMLYFATIQLITQYRLDLYLPIKENKFHLSKKYINEMMRLHTREVPDIFDPKTRNEALMSHFHGTQCPKCKSWRTDLAPDDIEFKCRCYACDARFEHGVMPKCVQCHLPFFDEIIKKMQEDAIEITNYTIRTKCIKCKNEVSLPIKQIVMFQTCK